MLFLSSYIPLFAVFAFQTRFLEYTILGISGPYHFLLFVGLCVLPLPILYLVVQIQSRSNPDFKEVDEYQRRNDQITSYLLVYVFAFLGLELSNTSHLFAFGVFFLTVAIIQIRSAQLHVNPILGLFGYDIYRVKSGREIALIVSNHDIEEMLVPPEDDSGRPNPSADERYLKVAKLGKGVYITQNYVKYN